MNPTRETGVAVLASTKAEYADVFEDVDLFVRIRPGRPVSTPAHCSCPRCAAHLAGTPPDPDPGCAFCAATPGA